MLLVIGPLHHAGGAISPFNAWLIMRGSVTLPLRLRHHCGNAQDVAEFLEQDPRITYVAYPGLASHPQHALAPGGYGGVVSFAIGGSHEDRLRFRQRPAGRHLGGLPRSRRDPHRLRKLPRYASKSIQPRVPPARPHPPRGRPGVTRRHHRRPRRRPHHRLRPGDHLTHRPGPPVSAP